MEISKDSYWIIDFDSTFIKVECMPELARIALAAHSDKENIVKKIEEITDMGMNGEITFTESLSRRVQLLNAHKSHIEYLVRSIKDQVSSSIITNKKFIIRNFRSIYVITGGFKEFVVPIVKEFGIAENHVLANTFEYDRFDNIIGFDQTNPLANMYGKAKVVEELNLGSKVIVIGDGMTDYEVKEKGMASKFIAFVENVSRATAIARADFIAHNFSEIISMYAS